MVGSVVKSSEIQGMLEHFPLGGIVPGSCLCVLSRFIVSNSLGLHVLYLTRLLCPWDSPGKNTAVGCHAILHVVRCNSLVLQIWSSLITADGDCSHEIKRCLLLGRKVMANLDSIFKSRDITLPTKVRLVKAMVFPVVMYGCESWTVKKAEC